MPSETAVLVLAADPSPAPEAGDAGPFGWAGQFLPFVLIFLIFYMLLIRPQSRERKKREEQLKTVRKHDRIVTNAGIHGTVVGLGETDLLLEVADDVRIRVERSAIWQIRTRADDDGKDAQGGRATEGAEAAPPAKPAAERDRTKEKGKATG